MFSAVRFAFAAVPAVFFIRPPRASARIVIAYGLAIGVAQFGLLFLAIRLGMPAGLASLVIQLQVFFTILIARFVLHEQPSRAQVTGALIAFSGVVLIGSDRAAGAALWPFLLTIGAALSWGFGNVIGKQAGRVDMLAFTVWSSLAAPLPLVGLSLIFEGTAGLSAVLHPHLFTLGCALFLAYAATLFGYGAWARLLSRHKAAQVTPFALLVPVFGMGSAWLVFGERASLVEWMGAGLVLAGLSFNLVSSRFAGASAPAPRG
jgi:O-acetylserine/cysteine efflux transporter